MLPQDDLTTTDAGGGLQLLFEGMDLLAIQLLEVKLELDQVLAMRVCWSDLLEDVSMALAGRASATVVIGSPSFGFRSDRGSIVRPWP